MPTQLTVDVNSEYIQQLYRERDQALARNRELEDCLSATRKTLGHAETRNGDLIRANEQLKARNVLLEACISDAIALAEEK